MFLTSGPLSLRVRPQNVLGRKDTAPYQASSLEQWQNDLPLANPAELARVLYDKLEHINQAELSAKDRYRSLDTMRRPIHQLQEQIDHQCLFQAGLLAERERKLNTMLLVIYNELGVGYNTVLTEMLESSSRYYNEEICLGAAARAIDSIHHALLTSLRLYNPDPKHVWYELHRIYHFLEQNQLLNVNLRSAGWDSLTPATLYKRCLMLSAANLYQLHSSQIKPVTALIEQLAPLCTLTPYVEQRSGLIIDIEKDEPPVHLDLLQIPAQPGWRLLQLEPALEYLQQQLASEQPELQSGPNSNGIWHHLLRAWGALSKRSFARAPYHAQAQACIGLASSHYYLLEESDDFSLTTRQSFMQELSNNEISQSFAVRPAQLMTRKPTPSRTTDPWDLMQRNRMQKLQQQQQPPVSPEQKTRVEAGARVQYPLQTGTVVNISPNGYRLAIHPPYPQQLQIGELIAIKETQENRRVLWHLGSVCWLRHLGAEIHIGIRLLAPMATPLIYQSPVLLKTPGKTNRQSSQRALLLPSLKGIGQPSTLLGPAGLKEHQEIEVRSSHERFWVRLNRLLHATQSYRQFEFERIEGPSHQPEPASVQNELESVAKPRKRLWSRF